jgi:P4 family phage/plasmid primase-like protien
LAPYPDRNGKTLYSKHLFSEVIDIIKGLSYKTADQFDQDLDIINVENGLLNWRTMTLELHRPTYYSRIQLNVRYDPDKSCPKLIEMFRTLLHEEDYQKAMEFISYCLYRSHPIQKFFILLGPAGTGKSHFISAIRNLLGEGNCASISMHALEEDRFATSELYLKLLNEFGDIESGELPNVNILKALVANVDKISAQEKFKNAFKFINYAKLIFGANSLPKIKDDSGFFRRVEIVLFEHVFSPAEVAAFDDSILKNPDELSGLLNYVLPYLGPLLERNSFDNSYNVVTAKEKYKCVSSPVSSFIERHVEEDPNSAVSKDDMYKAYEDFCKEHKVEPLNKVWFGRQFSSLVYWKKSGVQNFEGVNKTCWLNTKLI